MRRSKILIVDDEKDIRLGLRRFLQAKGYDVEEAGDCREAQAAFTAAPPDLAILDQSLPDGDGIDLLPLLKQACPGVLVVMLTAHGSIDLAVRAIKDGAEQFLTKPIDLEAMLVIFERLLEDQRNRRKQLAARPRSGQPALDPFLGTSAPIRELAREATRLSQTDRPVLVQGETGTGKGVLARWLHENGPRSREAFVDLNCAGLSRELLDTELFGHEPGAFTGATKSKSGLLDVAHRGTLFLDEIGDMDVTIQPKLLKALEEQRFRRLGDVRDRCVDVRLIAASHQDLGLLMKEQRFREDLYFRVSTLPLHIPPLRERREDIPVLARGFVDRFARELGRQDLVLSEEAVLEVLRVFKEPLSADQIANELVAAGWNFSKRDPREAVEAALKKMLENGQVTHDDTSYEIAA